MTIQRMKTFYQSPQNTPQSINCQIIILIFWSYFTKKDLKINYFGRKATCGTVLPTASQSFSNSVLKPETSAKASSGSCSKSPDVRIFSRVAFIYRGSSVAKCRTPFAFKIRRSDIMNSDDMRRFPLCLCFGHGSGQRI